MASDGFEGRIRRIEETLARIADGDLTAKLELSDGESALSGLEMGINFLVVDLRSASAANKEKEGRLLAQQRELELKLETIERQSEAIRLMSTPVLEVWDDILVLPIVGVVDESRGAAILETVLARVVANQAAYVVIDVTGCQNIDATVASHLIKVVRATALLGAYCVLTGLTPAGATTLTALGSELTGVQTLRTLKDGLFQCLARLGSAKRRPGR